MTELWYLAVSYSKLLLISNLESLPSIEPVTMPFRVGAPSVRNKDDGRVGRRQENT